MGAETLVYIKMLKKHSFIKFLFIWLAVFLTTNADTFGQESEKRSHLAGEFTLSVNKTIPRDEISEGRYAFGLGVYRNFLDKRTVNLLVGLEYNLVRKHYNYIAFGSHSHSETTFNIGYYGVPIMARVNIKKAFINFGYFMEQAIYEKHIEGIHNPRSGYGAQNFGFLRGYIVGIGAKFPIQKQMFFMKMEYKHGVNDILVGNNFVIYTSYARAVLGYAF